MQSRSETLFHFTKKIEHLLSILDNGFWPRYCAEDLSWAHKTGKKIEHAYPMTCLCDIPLTRIIKHTETYGKFGIGVKKEWAKKNKFSPVLYIEKETPMQKSVKELIKLTQTPENIKDKTLRKNLLTILSHTKPTIGKNRGDSADKPETHFYKELEWRHIATSDSIKKTLTDLDEESISKANNQTHKHCLLKIQPGDINFIIVEKESDIETILQKFDEIYNEISLNKKILTTRIISTERILTDF